MGLRGGGRGWEEQEGGTVELNIRGVGPQFVCCLRDSRPQLQLQRESQSKYAGILRLDLWSSLVICPAWSAVKVPPIRPSRDTRLSTLSTGDRGKMRGMHADDVRSIWRSLRSQVVAYEVEWGGLYEMDRKAKAERRRGRGEKQEKQFTRKRQGRKEREARVHGGEDQVVR